MYIFRLYQCQKCLVGNDYQRLINTKVREHIDIMYAGFDGQLPDEFTVEVTIKNGDRYLYFAAVTTLDVGSVFTDVGEAFMHSYHCSEVDLLPLHLIAGNKLTLGVKFLFNK